MQQITLKGRVIVEGQCKTEALVSTKPLSFLGGVDPTNGKIIEKNHDLHGECARACGPEHQGEKGEGEITPRIQHKGAPDPSAEGDSLHQTFSACAERRPTSIGQLNRPRLEQVLRPTVSGS